MLIQYLSYLLSQSNFHILNTHKVVHVGRHMYSVDNNTPRDNSESKQLEITLIPINRELCTLDCIHTRKSHTNTKILLIWDDLRDI